MTLRGIIIAGIAVASGFDWHGDATGSARQQLAGVPAAILYEGATIERAGTHGQTHRYEVSLNDGDFLEVSVSQDQLLVTVSADGPDGTRIHSMNIPDIDPLPEHLMFVASASGRHSVDVSMEISDPPYEHVPAPRREAPRAGRVRAACPGSAAGDCR